MSPPPYDSLNLGFHVGDDPGRVGQNRALLSNALSLEPSRLTSPRQRHTATAALLDDPGQVGAGAYGAGSAFDPCDALFTAFKKAPLLLHFADCVPVALCGEGANGPVVGIIHAGRKGLAQGVIARAIAFMWERLGAAPGGVTAAIGPSIGPCCYEVDAGITAAFRERFGPRAATPGNHLDLRAAATGALGAAGVPADNMHILDICTACDSDFYSYRRDGITGRHGAIGWLA